MSGKINLSFFIFHLFILTYLIVTVVGAPDNVMLVLHIMAPFVVVSFLYLTLKTFILNNAPSTKEGL